MPLPFIIVCDLLEKLHKRAVSGDKSRNSSIVSQWFVKHRGKIDAPDTDASAFLSTLLPEKRSDRVYAIQAPSLEKIISRGLCLGLTRKLVLGRYRTPGCGEDLGDCVSFILTETPNFCSDKDQVTVEEIDALLHSLAASTRFSSPAVRASHFPRTRRSRVDLEGIYRRLQAQEAKWFTRLVLKDFRPITMDPDLVYHCFNPLLPMILRVHDNISLALSRLQSLASKVATSSGPEVGLLKHVLLDHIKPTLGVKVGRQTWLKGRSIQHCMNSGYGNMSCEQKVDGEYCQIHIDLSKGNDCIQIFSKSGKDSTKDRAALHGAILESLHIGHPTSKITKGCILEGELIVYSDKEQRILPFHKIRKYVSRSGVFLRTEQDSQPHAYERLMIVYFDALLIDDESLLGARHSQRFKRLENLVTCRKGHAELVRRQVIRWDQPMAASHLRKAFAKVITAREEGLVLKPDDPYFDFSGTGRIFSGCPIKFKKEYVANFGDVGDFAVVGARYDPDRAKCYRIRNVKWTHFFLGCLNNKEAVQSWMAKPDFTVIQEVELNETLLKTLLGYSFPAPVPFKENDELILRIAPGVAQGKKPTVVFTNPLVFDVRCFNFDLEGNTGFLSPRFPQVTKVHFDRSYMDTITFSELQSIAEDSKTMPVIEDSQEVLQWIEELERADPRRRAVDAVSQSTTSSILTPPPRSFSARQSLSPAGGVPESPLTNRRPVPHLPTVIEIVEAPATPPRSSNAATQDSSSKKGPRKTGSRVKLKSTSKKRSKESVSPRKQKRRKTSQTHEVSITPSSPGKSTPASQIRTPLADIDGNMSASVSRSSFSLSFRFLPSVPEKSFEEITRSAFADSLPSRVITTEMQSSQALLASTASDEEAQVVSNASNDSLTRSGCSHAGSNCLLANDVVLLSPCVANQPWITEDLLPLHGITDWICDPREWLPAPELLKPNTPYPAQAAAGAINQPAPQTTEHRPRKICLVETNRTEATNAFLANIEKVSLDLPRGRSEYVTVYDWRVLEGIDEHERMRKGRSGLIKHQDPRRKSWVGLAKWHNEADD